VHHVYNSNAYILIWIASLLSAWIGRASLVFSPIDLSRSLSPSLSLSLSTSPKYPRPLPIPYADVHPALLSIRSAYYAAFTYARDGGTDTIVDRTEKLHGLGERFKLLLHITTEIVGCFAAFAAVSTGTGLELYIFHSNTHSILIFRIETHVDSRMNVTIGQKWLDVLNINNNNHRLLSKQRAFLILRFTLIFLYLDKQCYKTNLNSKVQMQE